MGQMGSKTFRELHDQDDDVKTTGTPKRCVVLNADPRSPSVGLDRTPITIAAAASKVTKAEVEKEASVTLHDPRSPSCGIDRTPIYTNRPEITEGKKESLLAKALPTRHLFGGNDYESFTNENDDIEEVQESKENDSLMEKETENQEPSDSESEADAQLLQFHTPMKDPGLVANALVGHGDLSPFVDREMGEDVELKAKNEDVDTELTNMSEDKLTLADSAEQKKVSKIPVSKTRKSPVNPSANSKLELVSQRSPLAPRNVDSDTPKALIQRKQMRNLAMQVKNQSCQSQLHSGGLVRSLQMSQDKENM